MQYQFLGEKKMGINCSVSFLLLFFFFFFGKSRPFYNGVRFPLVMQCGLAFPMMSTVSQGRKQKQLVLNAISRKVHNKFKINHFQEYSVSFDNFFFCHVLVSWWFRLSSQMAWKKVPPFLYGC